MDDGPTTGDPEASRSRPPGDRRAGPPPRPPLTSSLPLPAPPVPPRVPGTVRAAAWCWGASAAAGGVALVAAVLDLAGVRRRLVDTAATTDPGTTADLLRRGADTALVATLGPLALLVVLGLLALLLHLRRRGAWTRVLLVLGVLTIAVDVLAQDLLDGGPDVDRAAVLAQGGFVVAALVLLLVPAARAWSRSGR